MVEPGRHRQNLLSSARRAAQAGLPLPVAGFEKYWITGRRCRDVSIRSALGVTGIRGWLRPGGAWSGQGWATGAVGTERERDR